MRRPRDSGDSTAVSPSTWVEGSWVDAEQVRAALFDGCEAVESFTLKWLMTMRAGRPSNPLSRAHHRLVQRVGTLGATHAAVQVGRHVMHWTGRSQVLVEPFTSQNALLLYGDDTSQVRNTTANQDAIIQVVLRWSPRRYSESLANCQQFVNDVFEAVGHQLDLGGAVGRFLRHVKQLPAEETAYPTLVREDGSRHRASPLGVRLAWTDLRVASRSECAWLALTLCAGRVVRPVQARTNQVETVQPKRTGSAQKLPPRFPAARRLWQRLQRDICDHHTQTQARLSRK